MNGSVFFIGQVHAWSRFLNTGSHTRTKITPPPPSSPSPHPHHHHPEFFIIISLVFNKFGCANDRISDLERITVYFKSHLSWNCIHLAFHECWNFSWCHFVILFVFACLFLGFTVQSTLLGTSYRANQLTYSHISWAG